MKFTTAVVMLALAVSASASILPVPLASLGLASPWNPWAASLTIGNPWASPLALAAPRYAIAPQQISLSQGFAAPLGYPIARAIPIAAPVAPVVAAPIGEANYVAANRGSVHVAPLPGHLQSVSSNNLEPAPGTL